MEEKSSKGFKCGDHGERNETQKRDGRKRACKLPSSVLSREQLVSHLATALISPTHKSNHLPNEGATTTSEQRALAPALRVRTLGTGPLHGSTSPNAVVKMTSASGI
ncbi:hypothetical protein Trydic_g17893 [Trypoxylus dichotomus]